MAQDDYYSLLGVDRQVDASALKKAYRKKAVKYHPDKNPGDSSAEAMFKKVTEAYEVLSNEEKRAAYDRYGHDAFTRQGMGNSASSSAGGQDPFDVFRDVFGGGGGGGGIFEEFFGGGSGGGRSSGRGSDLRYDLEIALEEAASGAEKEIRYRRPATCDYCGGSGAEPGAKVTTCGTCGGNGKVNVSRGFFSVTQACDDCRGTGQKIEKLCNQCRGEGRVNKTNTIKLRIPAGVDNGTQLRSTGNGEAGVNGAPSGDLFVVLHLKDHEIFERSGDDLFCEIPIKFTLAALGGTLQIPTLLSKATLKIPGGTQSGTTFRLREHGIANLRTKRKGDQMVKVKIEVPKRLNSEQRQKLEEYAFSCGDAENPFEESFLEKAKRFFDKQ